MLTTLNEIPKKCEEELKADERARNHISTRLSCYISNQRKHPGLTIAELASFSGFLSLALGEPGNETIAELLYNLEAI